MDLHLIVDREEDGCWIVEIPKIPGVWFTVPLKVRLWSRPKSSHSASSPSELNTPSLALTRYASLCQTRHGRVADGQVT